MEMNCWKVASVRRPATYPCALAAISACVVSVPVAMCFTVKVLPAATYSSTRSHAILVSAW